MSEMDRRNVTLFCDVKDGNPAALVSVRWYFDGELLKQVRPHAMNEVVGHSSSNAKYVQEVDHSNESDNETLFVEKSSYIHSNESDINETLFIEESSGIIAVSSFNQPGVRPRHVLLTVCRYELDFTNLPMKHRQ